MQAMTRETNSEIRSALLHKFNDYPLLSTVPRWDLLRPEAVAAERQRNYVVIYASDTRSRHAPTGWGLLVPGQTKALFSENLADMGYSSQQLIAGEAWFVCVRFYAARWK